MKQNTLKEFGNTFQAKCISALVTDRSFLERIYDILSPAYFDTDSHKWILNLIMAYYEQYKDIPTMDVFKVEITNISDVVLQAAVFEQVKQAYKAISVSDIEYVKDKFLQFCKNQKLKNAIYEASNLLDAADYDGIWKLIDEASRAGAERNVGHDYFDAFEERMSEAARNTIKTGWDIIDTHLDGGLGNGELGFVVAPAGSGKSWILTRIGVSALKQGKNVMHFTMELNEKYVGRRYDSCFSGIAFQDIRKYQDVVKKALADVKGKLYIKYFPMNTASALSLKSHIERTQIATRNKIDLVIVDYADLLRPFTILKNTNSYEQGGNTYGELRGMAGELQLPVWSASQANRGAHEEEFVGALNVADSYKKIMIGDFIMSLSRKTEDKKASTGRISILKSRFGSDGPIYPTKFDASCGNIDIYDPKSVEGIEILKKCKDEAENMKDIIRSAWNKTHNKDDSDDQF